MGLEKEGLFLTFFPWKGGGGGLIRDVGLFERGGGLNRGLTVAYDMDMDMDITTFDGLLMEPNFCSVGSTVNSL